MELVVGQLEDRVRASGSYTLLALLQTYEEALTELRAMDDPALSGLMRRLERRRAETVVALAQRWFPED